MSEQSPFAKKTVYHSQLVAEGKMEVLITSDVAKSKFKKDGQDQFYICFKYKGKEQQYTIENDAIQKKLHGLKGHVVSIEATGSRDEADMEVFDAAGPASDRTQAHREERPAPTSAPPAATGDVSPLLASKRTLLQHINARLLSMEAARTLIDEWVERHGDDLPIDEEHFARIASNFYIALDRKGLIDILPYDFKQPKSQAPPPKQKPPPPPPAAESGPDDDDEIPF